MEKELEIVSREIKVRLSKINSNIKLIPLTFSYLILELISDLSTNIYFSSQNNNDVNINEKIKIDLFASISDTLIALHSSEKYNFLIRAINNSNSIEEIKNIVDLCTFEIVNTSVFAPKFHNNLFNIFAKNKIYCGAIGFNSLEKLLIFSKSLFFLSRISLYKFSFKSGNFVDRKQIIDSYINNSKHDLKTIKLFILAVLILPTSLCEHVDYIINYNKDNMLKLKDNDIVISQSISQYSEILLSLKEQYKFKNIIIQHGIGFNEIKGDIRHSLENLISDKWISWTDNDIPSPKLKLNIINNPIYTTIVFPRLEKFYGRTVMSCNSRERDSLDEIFLSSLKSVEKIEGLRINTHLSNEPHWHVPRVDISDYQHTKGKSFDYALKNSSSILCFGITTALIEAILSPVPTLWMCPSQIQPILQGYLLSLYNRMIENNLVFSEKSDFSKLQLLLHPDNYSCLKEIHKENSEFLQSQLNLYSLKKFLYTISNYSKNSSNQLI